jgi:hypothetical protein
VQVVAAQNDITERRPLLHLARARSACHWRRQPVKQSTICPPSILLLIVADIVGSVGLGCLCWSLGSSWSPMPA